MKKLAVLTVCGLSLAGRGGGEPQATDTQATGGRGGGPEEPPPRGQSIGTVTAHGDLAVLELDEGVITEANLFDLEGRTLRFTPADGGYRVENLPLEWDSDFGPEAEGNRATIEGFEFPFSGRTWSSVTIGNGALTFVEAAPTGEGRGGRGRGGGRGLSVGRFDELREGAPDLVNTVPGISVFLKPRSQGPRHVKELGDRLVVTWELSEPSGGMRSLQDFTFDPTTNRFQAVLHQDGRIDMSWDEIDAADAVVGVYSVPSGGVPPTDPVDLSERSASDQPAPVLYEAFHYYGLPGTQDMACTVIEALGDRFDFMVWYSDFRVDQQEGGTPSTGAIGDRVTGLGESGPRRRQPEQFCSDERIQSTYILPVWIGSNQAMEGAPDGSWGNYDFAMSQIAHELGHRWAAFSRAIVDGDTITLGPTHWAAGLHAEVPYSYSGDPEASLMGGGNWRDNGDGTYTRLADNFYSPASGPSYLDLYLMGMLAVDDVPDFFLLQNLEETGEEDEDGYPIYTGDRLDITIEDVIAYNGPRLPPFEEAQREFSTAMVGLVLPGQTPSPELLERLEGIRQAWVNYWSQTSGGISTMETSLQD
jgi:hypothetical protein